MNALNEIFWLVFAIAAIVSIIIALSPALFWLGVIFGLFVILAGVAKLEQDKANKDIDEAFGEMEKDLTKLSKNFEKSHLFFEETKEISEKRIQRLDAKRVEIENKTEKMYRDIIKKIIEIENKLSKMKKAGKK